MSNTQPWLWSSTSPMNGPGGSSITIGPSFKSTTPEPYGVSELSVKPTWRGPVAAMPHCLPSSMPTDRLPLKMPSTDTVGYQKRYATIARCNAASSRARWLAFSVGKPLLKG